MNKPTPMKGKGHPNKVQTTSITKTDGKKKDDDSSFIYNLGILIGCVAEIETKKGEKFEGVLSAFTNQALKIMIEAAHEPTGDDESSITKHYDLLIVPADKVSVIKFRNAELSYATRDFQTDSVISATKQLSIGDKELTPWDGAEEGEVLELESDTNGWAPQDMFKANEAKYGVITSYSEDLSGYTTQIDKTDAENFKKHEEKAALIAKEIENSQSSRDRTKVENGDGDDVDEEDRFSAVRRPSSREPNSLVNNHAPPTPSNPTQNSSNPAPPMTGSQKYIPPSKRRSQENNPNIPGNAPPGVPGHPPNSNNNNNRDNVPPRKANLNRDRSYASGPNPQYMGPDRSGGRQFDRGGGHPRGPYSHSGRMMEDGPPTRGGRGGGRGGTRRDDRDRINDLKHFGQNLRLTISQEPGGRARPPGNQQPQHSGPPGNVHMTSPVTGGNVPPPVSNSQNVRNTSPPGGKPVQISTPSPVKPKKEEFPPVPPLVQPSGQASAVSENSNGSGTSSPHTTSKPSNATSASPSPNSSSSSVNPPSNETVPSTPVSAEGQTPAVVSNDSKSSTEAENKNNKKTFTFNPNAKEFNPTAKPFTPQRSPSTPPRPPSTPASTQQLVPAPAPPSLMPLPVHHQTLIFNPYTSHAQAGFTHSNSQGSSGGNTPRHRKGMVNAPQRPDMTPPMQMSAGPPLLSASIHAAAPPAQFAYLQHHGSSYAQMMGVVPQGMVPIYQPEGAGGAQMHSQMHYIHNGAAPGNAGHQQGGNPQSNPPTSNVPTNGHAYGQGGANHGAPHPMSYPYISLTPVVRVPCPPGPPAAHIIPAFPVVHSGGGNSGIPHSQ